jgi:nitrate/nitrite-specific signal transduction histidine kinase
MSTTTEKMSENLKKYRARLEEIRSDWTRSDEAKRQDLEAAYTEARGSHEQLADEYRSTARA